MLGVAALILVMLIPLLMIEGVLSERLRRRNEAVAEITSSWGPAQHILGPVLGIPYHYRAMAVREVPAADGRMERREMEETNAGHRVFSPREIAGVE